MSPGWRLSRRAPAANDIPAWIQAKPASIQRALDHALNKPCGGWFVLDASRRITAVPRAYPVAGRTWIAWRERGELCVAPEACPHMGASLVGAKICAGALVCPWHGLRLGPEGHGAWKRVPCHDDGVLAWARVGDTEEPTAQPIVAPRPKRYFDGVIRLIARCKPCDVLANRLDPWHGAFLHPYSFGAVQVIENSIDAIKVRVEKRIVGPLRVEVDATFHCPDARTIVMTIVEGEGAGSVVETHATPLDAERTAIIEATFATSERKGFGHVLFLRRLVRPFIERAARRLWVDDAAYAERLAELRRRSDDEGHRTVSSQSPLGC